MFKIKSEKIIQYSIISIVIIYTLGFGFLTAYDSKLAADGWIFAPFIKGLIEVFMAAGAIAVITAIIIVFQSKIHAEQEKKQRIFETRLELYKRIIRDIYQITGDGKLSDREERDLKIMLQEVRLLCTEATNKSFTNLYEKCLAIEEDKETGKTNVENALNAFITDCFLELGVRLSGSESKNEIIKIKEADEKRTEELTTLYSKTFYKNIEEKIKSLEKECDANSLEDYKELFNFIDPLLENKKIETNFSKTVVTWTLQHTASSGNKRRLMRLKNPSKNQFNLDGLGQISADMDEYKTLTTIVEKAPNLNIRRSRGNEVEVVINKPLDEDSRGALKEIIELYSNYMSDGKPFEK